MCPCRCTSHACADETSDNLDSFVELINDLKSLQSVGLFAGAVGNESEVGAAVLGYALRDVLFVGELYTLDVVESDEVEAASVEFFVKYTDYQRVCARPRL